MKKVTEKDLSLDKQVVSELSSTDTKVKTNEVVCATKVCTDSHFEICCAATKEDDCVASEACVAVNDCPATKDENTCVCLETDESHCELCSYVPGCMIPVETVDC